MAADSNLDGDGEGSIDSNDNLNDENNINLAATDACKRRHQQQ